VLLDIVSVNIVWLLNILCKTFHDNGEFSLWYILLNYLRFFCKRLLNILCKTFHDNGEFSLWYILLNYLRFFCKSVDYFR